MHVLVPLIRGKVNAPSLLHARSKVPYRELWHAWIVRVCSWIYCRDWFWSFLSTASWDQEIRLSWSTTIYVCAYIFTYTVWQLNYIYKRISRPKVKYILYDMLWGQDWLIFSFSRFSFPYGLLYDFTTLNLQRRIAVMGSTLQ